MNRTFFMTWIIILVVLAISTCPAQNESTRIACIGNSITYGYLLNNTELDSYPGQLNSMLGADYNVRNFGVSSRTMLKKGDYPYWKEPEFTEALAFNPDTVIIMLGGNDTKPHNWQYKDEFITDYVAMIDTFQQLDSDPVIWICYPTPGFGGWTFADSIYTTEMIPMIDQVLQQRDVSLIDFHTPLIDQADFFPDGVHPNIEGAGFMAKIVFSTLTNQNISTMYDVNLALNKSISVSDYLDGFPPEGLNDGNPSTRWISDTIPGWVVIDLDTVQKIDMFKFNFSDRKGNGYQYVNEVSEDSINWVTVVDQSARSDTSLSIYADVVDPIDAQYVKFTVTGALYDEEHGVEICEFGIYKYSDAIHAPILNYLITRESTRLLEFELEPILTTNVGEAVAIYWKQPGDHEFNALTGYRAANQEKERITIKKEDIHLFYAIAFKDGKEVISDTLQLGDPALSIGKSDTDVQIPTGIYLYENFPNPFNPRTIINYELPITNFIELKIYNLLGKKVATLVSRRQKAGYYKVEWDASGFASGVYYYRLSTDTGFAQTKKLVVLK
jgi:lysophospholipase L1-like esterase